MKSIIIFTSIITLLITGCAVPQNSGTQYVFKQDAKVSNDEINILQKNGYAKGVWSANCSDQQIPRVEYKQENLKYLGEFSQTGKIIKKEQFYDVREVSSGVITYKTQEVDLIANTNSIGTYKSGFKNGKTLIFESKKLLLTGTNAGKELIISKDGYEVIEKDSNLVNVKPNRSMTKCN